MTPSSQPAPSLGKGNINLPGQYPHPQAAAFSFERDTFAFANELVWEYRFDPAGGPAVMVARTPKPSYAHHCFVLVRAARQFFHHARFDSARGRLSEEGLADRIRRITSLDPRVVDAPDQRVVIPGFSSLRELSLTHESLLKENCGGAWQSYVLRSHWRMVFPIWRRHQGRTARELEQRVRTFRTAVVHLVRFPALTINHGMLLFEVHEQSSGLSFSAYDPNEPFKPTILSYDSAAKTFQLSANSYWGGGPLDAIEIFKNWLY